jgi:transcriptional regulator with XRE-family HTH domain
MSDESQYLKWLRNGLSKPGKTQKGLARALGIDPMGVSRLVNGKRKFQIGELQKISVYLQEPLPEIGRAVTLTVENSPLPRGVKVMGRIGVGIWQEDNADLGDVASFGDRRFPVEKQRSYTIDSNIPAFGLFRGAYLIAVPFKDYGHYATPTSLCIIERRQGGLKNFSIGRAGEKPESGSVIDLVVFAAHALV